MGEQEINRRIRPEWLEIDSWAAADGWRLRRFCVVPAPGVEPRGNLLFQAGRADFIEKYIESFDHWRGQGWAIEGFDWRGQGGSGRLLSNDRIGHGPPYEVMAGDLAAYCAEWTGRTAGPHILLGHSMGGHLVLRLLAEHALDIDGAVLLSPMLGLNTGFIGERMGQLIARLLCSIGWTERPAWSEDSNKGSGHRQRNLTHSEERYADELWWRAQDATLDVGPPTWGWLRDSWVSIASLFQPGVLERVDTRILMLCPEQDRLVMTPAAKLAASRLPNARLICHPHGAHELLREIDPVRKWVLAEIDGFLGSIGRRA
jgi:lysophospholipase